MPWRLRRTVPASTLTRPDPAQALHAHLAEICARMDRWPALFVVTAELDLRARRDPAVAAALDDLEAGWRVRLRHAPRPAPAVVAQLEARLGQEESPCTS